jgi:hypothetical protein
LSISIGSSTLIPTSTSIVRLLHSIVLRSNKTA